MPVRQRIAAALSYSGGKSPALSQRDFGGVLRCRIGHDLEVVRSMPA
jgi:hypothetical protein